MNTLHAHVLNAASRPAIPVAVYPGLHLTGGSTREVVTLPEAQVACIQALVRRYRLDYALTAMDLSAEAEAFGAQVRLDEHEIPTVIGRRLTEPRQVSALKVPAVGAARTAVHLEAVRLLAAGPGRPKLVLGGLIGPFSLAGRLWGVSEFLELTALDPDTAIALLEKASGFLIEYALAFKRMGASGVIMAEPAAGLLSPRAMAQFSSAFVRTIVHAVEDAHFGMVLHNCGARSLHLSALLESEARAYHFGAPMDMGVALDRIEPSRLVFGNLDPSSLFVQATPAEMRARAGDLLERMHAYPNAVLSSGCDVPPNAPLANVDAFFAAAGIPVVELGTHGG